MFLIKHATSSIASNIWIQLSPLCDLWLGSILYEFLIDFFSFLLFLVPKPQHGTNWNWSIWSLYDCLRAETVQKNREQVIPHGIGLQVDKCLRNMNMLVLHGMPPVAAKLWSIQEHRFEASSMPSISYPWIKLMQIQLRCWNASNFKKLSKCLKYLEASFQETLIG